MAGGGVRIGGFGSLDWRKRGLKPGTKRREEVAKFRDDIVLDVLPHLAHGPWEMQSEVGYDWVTATNPEGAVLRFMLDERDSRQATHLYAPPSDVRVDVKRASTFRASSPKAAVDGINARLGQLEPRRMRS